MKTTAFATVETMQAAIAANLRVSVSEMQRAIGAVVVTTSDRLDQNQAIALDAMAVQDPESQTTVFLADRIPAGQESWVFIRNTVLKCLRHEQPKDWEQLVGHLRSWRNNLGGNGFVPVPLNMVYEEAAARVAYLRLSDSDAQEALVAFAVEAAAKRGVFPSVDEPYGSVEAWLGELIVDLRGVGERLLGSDFPDFESKVLPGIAQSLRARVAQEEAAPAPVRYKPDRATLYQAAKQKADHLWRASEATGGALNAFLDKHGRGPMGLTPDAVKASPEYRQLKSESDAAMQALQAFNKGFVRDFAKERAADRNARYAKQVSASLPAAMVVQEAPVALTKEQILEQRVAVLARQLSEARSALESLVSPMNSGKGWLSSPYYKDDVTEHVGDVLGGPATMCDALWEVKALADLSLQQGGAGICSAYDVMELAAAGLASAAGSAHEEEMLKTLQRTAQVNIEGGESMIARELASVVDRCLFAGAEMVNVADKAEDAAPGF